MVQEPRAKLIKQLEAGARRLRASDRMAEAGRQALLGELLQALAHEAGSLNGADIEDLHQLRVALRRSRSALRLLRPYFRRRVVRRHERVLRSVMGATGPVRDLDVLLEDLARFDTRQQDALQQILRSLQRQRSSARGTLLFVLHSDAWEQFLPVYTRFLTKPGAGARKFKRAKGVPQQAGHVLPGLLHGCVARVCAYGPTLAEADADSETLHDLRIECKRLRYAVSLFADLLGPEIKEYTAALKRLQNLLGRMNDIAVAEALLARLMPGLDEAASGLLRSYLEALAEERSQLLLSLPAAWEHFNSRAVQGGLGSALLALQE